MTIPVLDPAAPGARPRIERCQACGQAWLTRRGFCPHCGGGTTMADTDGFARVQAVTVVHRAVQPSALGPPPYTIVMAVSEAFPDLRFMALAALTPAIGDRVRIIRHGDAGAPYLAAPAPTDREHATDEQRRPYGGH